MMVVVAVTEEVVVRMLVVVAATEGVVVGMLVVVAATEGRPSTLPQICGKPHFWPLRKILQV